MTKALDRARYDIAMEYAKRAFPHFQSIFNSDNKLPNLIASFLMLDCAIRCLGEKTIQEALDDDPNMKNLIADTQKEFPEKLKRLEENPEADNIIYVDFKNQGNQGINGTNPTNPSV